MPARVGSAQTLGVIVHTAQQELQLIIVTTSFTLPKPITLDEARSIFMSTAPKYQGVQGLFRKHYVLSQDGGTAGGVYLWKSRAEAEAMYTESWRSFVREKYSTDPIVTYLESPVTVDNVAHKVITDE
jgi:hypothetical protein